MKIALVHDYLVQYGGAERVLECFSEVFPDAPIHTLIHNPEAVHHIFDGKDIRTSWLQNWPLAKTKHRIFPALMSVAVESFDLSDYDVVLSDSSSFAKGVITGPETLHICYMHTPMRYAWDDCQKYTRDFYWAPFIKKLVPLFMNYLRLWDRLAVERVDEIIANSNFVRRRIRKYYHRESQVIYPPVDLGNFEVSETQEDYFLMVGRLMAYKRFDIAIEAFNRLGKKLKIIGRGPEEKKLEDLAGPNIEFLGRVSDEELGKYYSKCQAFIFPQEEDFGIVAVEAFASGRPVIAYRGGDIPEHLREGENGVMFDSQTVDDIVEAVKKFQGMSFDGPAIRRTAEKFDREIFKAKIKEFVEREFEDFKNNKS
ncbi:MAG: glycosyltransferase [Patescibacteria group bacterium]